MLESKIKSRLGKSGRIKLTEFTDIHEIEKGDWIWFFNKYTGEPHHLEIVDEVTEDDFSTITLTEAVMDNTSEDDLVAKLFRIENNDM